MLHKEAVTEQLKSKVDKIKEKYQQFECGDINADSFSDYIRTVKLN
jgi:hypothetical protein